MVRSMWLNRFVPDCLLSDCICLLPGAHATAATTAVVATTAAKSAATAIVASLLAAKQVQTVRYTEHNV